LANSACTLKDFHHICPHWSSHLTSKCSMQAKHLPPFFILATNTEVVPFLRWHSL
jgi:hypothetical protein